MILVAGDYIIDLYYFCSATRLSQEAPVPVLYPYKQEKRPGGAYLVHNQIRQLAPGKSLFTYGTISESLRIMANGQQICRINHDAIFQLNKRNHEFERRIIKRLKTGLIKHLIISDYGRGSFTEAMAERLLRAAKILDIPVFVDSKYNWHWWSGAFAAFPNLYETVPPSAKFKNIIQKMGEKGCSVNGKLVPQRISRDMKDTTGAGDCFIAAFVLAFSEGKSLIHCAEYANLVAGKSVEFFGTHAVTEEELYKYIP